MSTPWDSPDATPLTDILVAYRRIIEEANRPKEFLCPASLAARWVEEYGREMSDDDVKPYGYDKVVF